MEKKLLKKISAYLIGIAGVVLIIAVLLMWGHSTQSAYKNMSHILLRVEAFYKESEVLQDELLNRYANEYFTRLTTIDHILENRETVVTVEELQNATGLLNLDEIYIFDTKGKIVLSSDETSIGTGLLDNDEAIPFWQLIQENAPEMIFSLNTKEILECQPNYNYVAIASSNPDYSMILIGVDKYYGTDIKDDVLTKRIMEGMPTIQNESLFAVDRKTGKILGESGDNAPWLELSSLGNEEETLKLLQNAENGRMIWFMNKPVFLMSRTMDEIILVDMFYPVVRLTGLFWNILLVVVLVTIILCAVFLTLHKCLRKYVFSEIEMIQDNINRVLQGDDQNVEFKTRHDTEMKIITNTLNTWNRSVQSTQNRLNWAIRSANPNTAMFECFSYLNRIYWTDNFQMILGIDDNQLSLIENNVEKFWDYMQSLSKNADNDGITKANNKFLKIELHEVDGEYFGIILDKTDEIMAQEKQKIILEKALSEAETDTLTNLLNRRGFENRIYQEIFETDAKQVTLLMIDVDNFKQVNDTLGHPVGDKLLQQIAQLIKNSFRKSDIIARIGGDEFAVALSPNIPFQLLETKLQVLVKTVKEDMSEYNCNVSISVGAACVEEGVSSYKELYQWADEALYEAKVLGKNRYFIKEH